MSRLGIPRLLLRAGLNYQWRHPWQALLALIGIAMGVAIVLAVDLANGAAHASFELSSAQLRGAATHRIVPITGELPQSLYVTLATTPGHPPMAPVIKARVRVGDLAGRFQLVGVDVLSDGQFREQLPGVVSGPGSLGEWLASPGAVALSRSAARRLDVEKGDRLGISYQGNSHVLEVYAINEDESVGSNDLLIVDMATAQAVTGAMATISYIDLVVDDRSHEWLKKRLPASVKLVDIEQQHEGIVGLSAAFELNLTAMSLLALLVGVFLIFNAMSFSIVQRRNLMGRLRSLGVLTQEIYRVVLAEALILGIIGTVIGVVIGVWLGQGLTGIVASTVNELYYHVSADAMQVEWSSLLKACVLGILGTLVAAWLPARQAANTPPLTTLSRVALEHATQRQLPRLAVAGLLLLVSGLLIAFMLPGGVVIGFVGLFILLLGAVMITPSSLTLGHALFARIPLPGIWRMATRDMDRHMSRLGTATAALMVALAASVGIAVMVESMRTSVSDWLEDLLTGDLYVAAEGFADGASLPEQLVTQTPLLESVRDYSLYRTRKLVIGERTRRLVAARLAPQSRAGFELVAGSEPGAWRLFDQGGVLVSEPLAFRLDLAPGGVVMLPTPAGGEPFVVAAVFRDYATEHGRVFIDRAVYKEKWDDAKVDNMALFARDGDMDALKQRLGEQFGDLGPLMFTDARAIYEESMAVFNRTFRITEVLRLLSVLVAFVGILTALMAVQLERRKEFAVLRALGLTRTQVSQLIVIESVILGVLAALLALPTGLAMAWVLTDTIQVRAFGWTMPFTVEVSPLLLTLVIGAGAAFLASLYPAWQASRGDPAPQLRED